MPLPAAVLKGARRRTRPDVAPVYDRARMPPAGPARTVGGVERMAATAPGWAREAAAPLLVTAALLAVSAEMVATGDERRLDALAYALIVVCGVSLSLRRRRPAAAVVVITVALVVWSWRGYVGGPVYATSWAALFFLGYAGDRRRAFAMAAAASTALVAVGLAADSGPGLVHAVYVGWSAAAVFLGDALRTRRDHLAALEERARDLEQTREEETRRRLAEERLRIARDLHDTVAHSMATINIQAGAAAHVMDRQPARAREALLAIQQASGDVLDELAALLRLLRVDPGEEAATAPAPGMGQLGELVASARRAGLEVTLRVDEDLGEVPRPVALAAYRIVQESLTNVVRHAGSATATVTLARDAGGLCVEIVDDGSGGTATSAAPGAGVGIAGMRERAETTGGALEAGPRTGGGFRVRAAWPAVG